MRFWLVIAALVAVFVGLPAFGSEYAISFSVQLFIFIALAYSWNLIGGYAGYPHFGQVTFFGLGAYVGALLILRADAHWLFAGLVAGLCGGVVALPLGGAMLRLKGPFFAISMFGLTRVWESLALYFDQVTEGGTGLYLPPIADLRPVYYTLGAIALGMALITYWIDNSRLGLKLLAIREDETAADALGIRTTRLKILTFTVSAVTPAMCGALYATYLSFIDPMTAFAPMTELTTIAMVLFGGMGTVLGPLVGAVLLSALNEALWSRFQELYLGMVGAAIIAVVLFMPRGVVNVAAKRAWLPVGRSAFRRMASTGAQKTPRPQQVASHG